MAMCLHFRQGMPYVITCDVTDHTLLCKLVLVRCCPCGTSQHARTFGMMLRCWLDTHMHADIDATLKLDMAKDVDANLHCGTDKDATSDKYCKLHASSCPSKATNMQLLTQLNFTMLIRAQSIFYLRARPDAGQTGPFGRGFVPFTHLFHGSLPAAAGLDSLQPSSRRLWMPQGSCG